MGGGQLVAILRRVLQVAERQAQGQGDRQLLDRFVANKDEAAFAALLERHGRLVFGVCRSVLQNEHDAEDAFQATFLVLARMAASIRQRDSLPSWLYGVALRTAMKARRAMNTRRRHECETQPKTSVPPVAEAAERELEAILCEEIGQLPDKYRAPFVLCVLQGRSRADAAQELGWKEGTVSSRVAKARALLEASLTRRGIVVVPAIVSAVVPAALAAGVARAAAPFAAKQACETVSVAAVALAEVVIQGMLTAKVKTIAVLVFLLTMALGGGLLAHSTLPTDNRDVAQAGPVKAVEETKEPVSIPVRPERPPVPSLKPTFLRQMNAFPVAGDDHLTVLGSQSFSPVVFSSDGKRMAFGQHLKGKEAGILRWKLHVQDANSGKDLWTREADVGAAVFSPTPNILAIGQRRQVHLLRADTGELIRTLTVPPRSERVNRRALLNLEGDAIANSGPSCQSLAFSNDGALLAVISLDMGLLQRPESEDRSVPQFDLFDVATGKHRWHGRGAVGCVYRFAGFPKNGKPLAFEVHWLKRTERLVDLKSGKPIVRIDVHDPGVDAAAVSPDGKRCVWGGTKHDDCRLRIMDLVELKFVSEQKLMRGNVKGLLFSRAGDFFVSLSDDGIKTWDTATGMELRHFSGPEQHTLCMALSPDGKLLATGGVHGTVFLWDVPTGKFREQLLKVEGTIRSVRYSPDGTFLIAGKENGAGLHSEAIVWRLSTN